MAVRHVTIQNCP